MKSYLRRIISMILAISIFANIGLVGFAEAADGERKSAGDVFSFAQEITWAEAGKQIAGMLSFIVEDAANIDLTVHSARIANLSLEDDSIYLAILAEEGYLPEEPAQIDPAAAITADEYVQLMEIAFPTVLDSQEAIDSLRGEAEPGNIAILGDDLSVTTMLPERLAVAKAQQLSLTAVKATALSLNAGSSVDLSESEIARVHIHDTAVKEEGKPGEEVEPDVIYLHMDSGTELPEVIVKSADEVVIEGSGALGVVRVQETVGALTVRATGSVVNETEEPFEVTGPDAEVVELQPGEQVDFVLSKWLVSFVTEGTSVETQEIAPGGMVDFTKASTTLEGKVFTAWYEDAAYTQPVSRLSAVDRQTTLYARFIDESEAAVVTFETFGGRELEPMVFAKGEYLLTKPVESLYTSKEGYSFVGWCVDEECTTAFGYTDPIQESMTLYAMYSSYEQETREDPGTVAEIELPDGAATIGLVLPEGMTAAEAQDSLTVESGTGIEVPEIAVRETGSGAEVYCAAGFTPGTTFTLYAQNGVQFAGYPEYIDTLTVSVFREQVEVVEFVEGLTYALWDNVTDYTPVSKTAVEYTTDYAEDGTVHNIMEDHDAEGDVIPGKLVMTGKVDFQPEQVVVFYDGEINRDEAPVDAWEGGDLAGYVLFAEIKSVTANADGTSEVTFIYADPEAYIAELDVHTTEEVNLEEQLTQEQVAQVEKAIASQLASNDELKAQMMVAVMTSEETQRMLDEQYGPGTYSLAALVPYVSSPKLDIVLDLDGSTATAGIGVGITVDLYGPQGLLVSLTPYLYFEEQLTLDVNVDGGFLWIDMSVLFRTKTTVSLQLKATTGDGLDDILDEAKTTLEKIVNADGTATEDLDYQEAADSLMNTMQELIGAELEYQDLFAVPLLKFKYTFYGIITVGINVELVGQAGVVATFGVTVVADYGQKIGFNYNFLKLKGGSYKEKVASEVTTEVYLIGKIGVRVGIAVTLYVKLLQNVTVSITGSVYAYVELTGMFMYVYALSAGGGNYAGSLYLEVGIDAEIELVLEVEVFLISAEKSWTLWSERWPLYSKSYSMTMSVVQQDELDDMWALAVSDADLKTSFTLPYIPMKTYDMLTAACTENQLLFENLQEGNVTAKLTLENFVINGEPVSSEDPRTAVFYLGDGENGKLGVVYADELAAAANKVEDYQCDVVLTYENKNKSELIKRHRQVFPLSREFKMATTTVNVDIALYDWCAHAWGIEGADWDNDVVFEATFENTHVLGCPVEPTATGTIDLDAVIAAVKEQYPDIDGAALSWFNPTLNQVDRTVQYSIPRISNMCFLTPESGTVRYDIFATTNEYNLTFNLFASRFPGYTDEITYIIEASEVPAGTVFTVRGSDEGETMTFEPVEGEENRWSLTTSRANFNGTERPVMIKLDNGAPVASGLVINGREAESVVVLTLDDLSHELTVTYKDGIDYWGILTHDPSEMSAIVAGDTVTLFASLKEGYKGLTMTSEPAGLAYTADDNTVTFTMPSYDVKVILEGVRYYQASFQYNYGDLGTYDAVEVKEDTAVPLPADPYVNGLTFAGWYDNAACEGEPYDFSRKLDGNITLYADWRPNVTVDFGGAQGQALYVADRRYEEIDGETVEIVDSELIFPGNENEFAQFTYTTRKLGDTALEIILPNYDGYDFFGWYLTSDFSGDPVDPTEYVLTGGVTFYARWEKNAILTYELNYGEQEQPYAITLEHVGLPVENIPEDPQRDYYEFLGWFRSTNGGEADRVALDSYIAEGTMTLYAHWKPVEYAITYELNGGENDPSNPLTHSIESDSLPVYAPTRTGYTFLGWDVKGAELEKGEDGGISVPAGTVGEITLTAKWEPIVYTISTTLIRGKTAEPNPDKYTIESEEIVLSNPTAEGYVFTGWTGTGLEDKTETVVIPAGSTGDRVYTATWRPTDSIALIVYNALEAIPAEYTMKLSEFESVQDFVDVAMGILSEDEDCADYAGQLSVSVKQLDDQSQTGTSYLYTLQVTVTFTDDNSAVTFDSKEVELTVLKNPVTISAQPVYTLGGKYVPYGTILSNVDLTGTATSDGETIPGKFEWLESEADTVVTSANNDQEVYKVLFTPADAYKKEYSTAEISIAVNTQIGLRLMLDVVPETIEYMGRKLNVESADECGFYVTDIANGKNVDGVTPIVTGAVLYQSQITPGTAKVWLTGLSGCTLTGDVDMNLYTVVSTTGEETGDTVTITQATPILSGTQVYTADLGSSLSSIKTELTAKTKYQDNVAGVFEWETPSTKLNTAGTFTYKVVFTPSDLNNYTTATIQVTVNVSKQGVTIPEIPSVVYNRTTQKPSLSDTAYYTVVSNSGGTDAGEYPVTLQLRDAANYMWSDGSEEAVKNLTFTINPAPLKVSGNPSVSMLGYGQQLVGGQDIHTDKVYRSASDILSKADVTMEDGTAVAGWWEWTDENYVGKTLNASSASDNEDYGDGYDVLATFHPTSLDTKNFVTLEKAFLVEIERVTPDATNCGGYLKEGDIYMPSDNDPVARLSYFTPAVKSNPLNPNTDEPVSGSLAWEADRIPQVGETWANAKFTPSDSRNYKPDIDVKISWAYKSDLSAYVESESALIWSLAAGKGVFELTRKWTPDDQYSNITIPSVEEAENLGMICIYSLTVRDLKGNRLLLTSYTAYDPVTRQPKQWGYDCVGPAIMQLSTTYYPSEKAYSNRIIFPGDKYSIWNCTDVNIEVQFGTINPLDGEVTPIVSVVSYSLKSPSAASTFMLEPEMKSTTETTEEPTTIPVPGTIGNVVSIRPTQDAEQYGDFWVIPLEQDQQLVQFRWETSEPASEYFVYTLDEFGNPELIAQTTENSIWLPVEDYEDGCITLYVGAVLEDGSVTWGEAMFELIPFIDEPTEEPTEPTEEPTDPTEEPTDPTEEPTDPTEEPTDPTEEPTDPTEEPTDPTEESTDPTEEPTDPAEESTDPTEESTDPTEKTTDPTEESTDPTEEPTDPTGEPTDPTGEPTDPAEKTTDPAEKTTDPAEKTTDPTEKPVQETQAAEEAA
ncbi:MAG: InlB B-repeat-containing protein [Faecousia sp.]